MLGTGSRGLTFAREFVVHHVSGCGGSATGPEADGAFAHGQGSGHGASARAERCSLRAQGLAVWMLAPRHRPLARQGGSLDPETALDGLGATSDVERSARSEALTAKIEETRRRLREQVGMPPE